MPFSTVEDQRSTPHGPNCCFQHDRLTALMLDLGSQNEPFYGVQVDLPITRKNRNIKALKLYFSAVKSSRARNSKTEGVLDNSYGVPVVAL